MVGLGCAWCPPRAFQWVTFTGVFGEIVISFLPPLETDFQVRAESLKEQDWFCSVLDSPGTRTLHTPVIRNLPWRETLALLPREEPSSSWAVLCAARAASDPNQDPDLWDHASPLIY